MSEEKKEETIDVFEGWSSPDDMDFLGEELGETSQTEKLIDEVLNEGVVETTEEEETKEEKEKREEVESSFNEWETEKEEVNETNEETEENNEIVSKSVNVSTLNTLKEKGFIDYELEEDEELTDELAAELIEDKWDESIQDGIEQAIKDLPDSVKELIRYSQNGGNPDELLSKMTSTPSNVINENTDIKDVKNQKAIIRAARKEKGEDDETIDTYIDFLEESGKLEGQSEKEFSKIIETKKNFTKTQAAEQAKRKAALKERQRTFKKELTTMVNDSSIVKLSRQEKKEMPDYMAEPTVLLDNGNKVSQMQNDLFAAMADKEKALKLAKILKSDFDFTDFIEDANTENVKKIKGKVDEKKKINRRSSQPKSKSLADML